MLLPEPSAKACCLMPTARLNTILCLDAVSLDVADCRLRISLQVRTRRLQTLWILRGVALASPVIIDSLSRMLCASADHRKCL